MRGGGTEYLIFCDFHCFGQWDGNASDPKTLENVNNSIDYHCFALWDGPRTMENT